MVEFSYKKFQYLMRIIIIGIFAFGLLYFNIAPMRYEKYVINLNVNSSIVAIDTVFVPFYAKKSFKKYVFKNGSYIYEGGIYGFMGKDIHVGDSIAKNTEVITLFKKIKNKWYKYKVYSR
jgi:hypothetical protein